MLDLVFVGDERRLVDAVPADQQLVVQSQSQFSQTETLLQREVQSLQGQQGAGDHLHAVLSAAGETKTNHFNSLKIIYLQDFLSVSDALLRPEGDDLLWAAAS